MTMTKDEALKLALSTLDEVRQETFRLMRDGQTLYAEDKVWSTIISIKEVLAQPEQEPLAWMNNKDFEPIRVRIMQEAYELADRNDSEGYNAIKVMCGDVQRMLPPQRPWVGLTKEEIAEFDTWHDHREEEVGWCNPSEIVAYIEAKLRSKNNV